MTLIDGRTTKLRRQIIGVRDFFEYNSTFNIINLDYHFSKCKLLF
jgi:hypothetical protein